MQKQTLTTVQILDSITGKYWQFANDIVLIKRWKSIPGKFVLFMEIRKKERVHQLINDIVLVSGFFEKLTESSFDEYEGRNPIEIKPAAQMNAVEQKAKASTLPLPETIRPMNRLSAEKSTHRIKSENHIRIFMDIKETKDYSLFDPILGNRGLSKSKIARIVKDVESGFNMLPYFPILVTLKDERYKIIDGQHRKEVSELTKQPVYFLECNGLSIRQIAQLNSRGEKWKVTDFLNCYIKLEVRDYEIVQEIMKEFGTNIKITCDLLMYNSQVGRSTEAFQDGSFKCNFEQETRELLTQVKSIFADYGFCMDRYLIGAVRELNKQGMCDFERLKKKLAAAPHILQRQVNTKLYLQNIETVYNFNNSKREVIYN